MVVGKQVPCLVWPEHGRLPGRGGRGEDPTPSGATLKNLGSEGDRERETGLHVQADSPDGREEGRVGQRAGGDHLG